MYQPLGMMNAERAIALPAKAGETLLLEGEPCDGILELRSGLARAVSFSREGERQIMAFFFPGDMLGVPLSRAHRFSVEAVNDVFYSRRSLKSWQAGLAAGHSSGGHSPLSEICQEQNAFMARSLILEQALSWV